MLLKHAKMVVKEARYVEACRVIADAETAAIAKVENAKDKDKDKVEDAEEDTNL